MLMIYVSHDRRHQHYKHRKHSLQDQIGGRRQTNTESGTGSRRVSIQPEDATLEVCTYTIPYNNIMKCCLI